MEARQKTPRGMTDSGNSSSSTDPVVEVVIEVAEGALIPFRITFDRVTLFRHIEAQVAGAANPPFQLATHDDMRRGVYKMSGAAAARGCEIFIREVAPALLSSFNGLVVAATVAGAQLVRDSRDSASNPDADLIDARGELPALAVVFRRSSLSDLRRRLIGGAQSSWRRLLAKKTRDVEVDYRAIVAEVDGELAALPKKRGSLENAISIVAERRNVDFGTLQKQYYRGKKSRQN